MITWSNSSLNELMQCPATFFLKKICKITPIVAKPAFSLGSAVHWCLENEVEDSEPYYEGLNLNALKKLNYNSDKVLVDAMVHLFYKNKEKIYNQLLTNEDGSKLKLVSKTITDINNVEYNINKECNELSLYVKIKSYKFKEDHNFMGIIDKLLLVEDEKGRLGFILLDYKTSSQLPNWDKYLDQLYRYRYILKYLFPKMMLFKIGIINLVKTGIRKTKKESEDDFKKRIIEEYEINDDGLLNYHIYEDKLLDENMFKYYIQNLSRMLDNARTIYDDKNFYLDWAGLETQYGKNDYYYMIFPYENSWLDFKIEDTIYDEDSDTILKYRVCVESDTKILFNDKVIYNFNQFKDIYEFLKETLNDAKIKHYILDLYTIDEDLLDAYFITYRKTNKN